MPDFCSKHLYPIIIIILLLIEVMQMDDLKWRVDYLDGIMVRTLKPVIVDE